MKIALIVMASILYALSAVVNFLTGKDMGILTGVGVIWLTMLAFNFDKFGNKTKDEHSNERLDGGR